MLVRTRRNLTQFGGLYESKPLGHSAFLMPGGHKGLLRLLIGEDRHPGIGVFGERGIVFERLLIQLLLNPPWPPLYVLHCGMEVLLTQRKTGGLRLHRGLLLGH